MLVIKRSEKEKLIYDYFKGRVGVFVEFGAFDGVKFSTCASFAKSGWSGVYAEPIKEYYSKLVKNYSENEKIRLANVAIGGKSGRLEFRKAGICSSASPYYQNYPEWAQYQTSEYETVAQITIDELLTLYKVPVGFELLVIDVEGMEWDVLKPFAIRKWRPELVMVELHKIDINVHRGDVLEYFSDSYELIYEDNIDCIFQRMDHGTAA